MDRKKIILAAPSWSENLGVFGRIARFTSTAPPMGICYLGAAALEAGWDAELIDNETERIQQESLIERIAQSGPDILGLSAMTSNMKSAVEIASGVKRLRPDTLTVIGGPHISAVGEEGFDGCFDIAVIGEGEMTLGRLLERYGRGISDFHDIPGLICRNNGGVVNTGRAEWIQDIDSIPFPARGLLKLERYSLYLRSRGKVAATSVVGSRGCPFKCAYCSEPVSMGRKARSRSAQSLVSEIESCINEHGISHFCFLNSTLTLNRESMIELSELILEKNLRITWSGWTRADFIEREMIRKMKQAGFSRVTIALENASEEILEISGRKMNLEKVREGFRVCAEEKLEVWCLAMIGLPGETEQSIRDTVEFIRELPGVLTSSLSIAIPYPGTGLYEMAKNGEHGLKLLTEDYSKFQRYDGGVMKIGDLTPEKLIKLQKQGLIRIHLTPARVVYFLRNMGLTGVVVSVLAMILSAFLKPATEKEVLQDK